jgi:hypothetical protein
LRPPAFCSGGGRFTLGWALRDRGSGPRTHLGQIEEYQEAGCDALYVANMGPHHQGMLTFYGEQILSRTRDAGCECEWRRCRDDPATGLVEALVAFTPSAVSTMKASEG